MFGSKLLTQKDGLGINGKWFNHISVSNRKETPFENRYAKPSGTPYFNETYKFSNIFLKSGRTFLNVKARIDLVIQGIFFISSNGIEINIDPGIAKEISYADTTIDGTIFYKFKTGYPPVDKQNSNNFYLVMAEGRCSFLKSIIKKVAERKDVVFGDRDQDFDTYESYYLFNKGEMKKLKRDKDFILAELSDKQEQVNQFLQSNKINLKNNEQLAKLINYYNTL